MARRKFHELAELARELQASSSGLTIEDMMGRTERSRRTVERMLKELEILGVEAERCSVDWDHHLTKRWKLSDAIPAAFLQLEGSERSTLEALLDTLPSGTERKGLTKLLASQRPAGTAIAIDQETLIERTSHLGRVGPRSAISETLMNTLEKAIKEFEELDIDYQSTGKKKAPTRRVQPLGLLFGRFGYLVARTGERGVLTYRLNMIEKAELAGTYFDSEGFNLKEWSAESFGIYHGDELLTVKLCFAASVADRAESVTFHSSQKSIRLPDGSLRVILKCRGHRELFWELMHPDWIGNVQIEGPEQLKREFLLFVEKA